MNSGDQEHIPGGFILLSRKLLKSGIMEESPLHLKLWIWMLLQASYKEHGNLKRGQFFTSYKKMQKAMAYKVGWRTEKPSIKELRGVMKTFMKGRMVGTMKVQHRSIITILNYDYYQNVENYKLWHEGHNEGHNEGTIKTKRDITNNKYSCQDKANDCPFTRILDLYHKILAELPRVRKFTEARKKMLKARWNEKTKSQSGLYSNTLEFWEAFFKFIRESDWLMGRTGQAWKAHFEWIIKKDNFNKIIEGIYHRD